MLSTLTAQMMGSLATADFHHSSFVLPSCQDLIIDLSKSKGTRHVMFPLLLPG